MIDYVLEGTKHYICFLIHKLYLLIMKPDPPTSLRSSVWEHFAFPINNNKRINRHLYAGIEPKCTKPKHPRTKLVTFEYRYTPKDIDSRMVTFSHLLYMGDIRLYAKSERDIDSLIHTTRIYNTPARKLKWLVSRNPTNG